MGVFWDLWQEHELATQREVSESLEDRVYQLEQQNEALNNCIKSIIKVLEIQSNKDIDGDGEIG